MAASSTTFFINPRVVCLGDSITQFGYSPDGQWVALLSDFLVRRCDVMNRGFSGYNSRQLRPLLPQLIGTGDQITILVIFDGTNDACDPTPTPTGYVPLDEYAANLQAMIDYAATVGIPANRVIMIAPPPVDTARIKNRTNIKDYVDRCTLVAQSNKIALIPLFDIILKDDPQHWQRHLIDGLHLSASGSLLLFNALQPVVTAILNSAEMDAADDEVEQGCCRSVRDLLRLNVDYWRRLRMRYARRMTKKEVKP